MSFKISSFMAGRLWWEGEIRAGEGSRPDQYLGVSALLDSSNCGAKILKEKNTIQFLKTNLNLPCPGNYRHTSFYCTKRRVDFFFFFFFGCTRGFLSSLTRDHIHAPAVEAQSLNHWPTREVLMVCVL